MEIKNFATKTVETSGKVKIINTTNEDDQDRKLEDSKTEIKRDCKIKCISFDMRPLKLDR